MGLKAKSFMDEGKLVPDEVVIGIVKERLSADDCKKGFILDGFQELFLRLRLWIIWVLRFSMSSTSTFLMKNHQPYVRTPCLRKLWQTFPHCDFKAQKEGVCDDCGGTLVQRKDDHPDTVLARLETYHKETEPLVSYYEKQGKLVTVKGQDDVEATTKAILEGIEA